MPLVNNKLSYDPEHDQVAGYYRCDLCEARARVGSKFVHSDGCKAVGLASTTLCFGPKQVAVVKQMAGAWGDEHTWYGLSLRHLKIAFPDLLDADGPAA
jgi:hypothetical protein